MPSNIPIMPSAPTPPQPGQPRAPFTSNAYSFILWLATTFITQLNLVIAKINELGPDAALATQKATEAASFASAASTSASAASAAAGNNVRGNGPEQAPANADLGTAAYQDQTWYDGLVAWDAASVASGSRTSTTVSIPGVATGDFVMASSISPLSGLQLWGEVTASDVVTLYLANLTGAAVDLSSATYNVRVMARTARR